MDLGVLLAVGEVLYRCGGGHGGYLRVGLSVMGYWLWQGCMSDRNIDIIIYYTYNTSFVLDLSYVTHLLPAELRVTSNM
jgi:hypothetical protein